MGIVDEIVAEPEAARTPTMSDGAGIWMKCWTGIGVA